MLLLILDLYFCAILCCGQQTKPNILFLLIDDLGWGNVGYHAPNNSEVITPNLDYLATTEGLQLNRHYVHYVCCPTRSSFQTGRLPVHIVHLPGCNSRNKPNSGIPQNMTCLGTKMKEAGFSTHIVGKWDAGFATPTHTAKGRGYDSCFVYWSPAIEYYKYNVNGCNNYNVSVKDLWQNDSPAFEYNNSNQYVELLFAKQIYQLFENSANETQPFFIVYTPHIVHAPQQVPKQYLMQFENDENNCSAHSGYVYPGGFNSSEPHKFHCRSIYLSMVTLLDQIVGNITTKLKDLGLWNNTLIVMSSDNGGPDNLELCAANNNPLRGAKTTVWEGGIRAASFVSGGYLPANRRGQIENGMIHIADWYTTFCEMFGVNPFDTNAAKHGLPPVEGYNVWPLISGTNSTSARTQIPIDSTTLIHNNYKLIIDQENEILFATWSGKIFPNSTSPQNPTQYVSINCSKGCLFDVVNDYTEHMDIAGHNLHLVTQLNNTLNELIKDFYENNDSISDSCYDPCWIAINYYSGFRGPYCQVNISQHINH